MFDSNPQKVEETFTIPEQIPSRYDTVAAGTWK
jgi:hypothetical protein